MKALCARYDTSATMQTQVNQANAALQTLRYCLERGFSLEKFTAKLQAAYNELDTCGEPVNNQDIVDDLWARIRFLTLQVKCDCSKYLSIETLAAITK